MQGTVKTEIGLTYASMLRSVLRNDPDVILVGKLRDEETAGPAIEAALTGRLVLSILHAKDAPSSLTRLLDMEIEPVFVADAVGAADPYNSPNTLYTNTGLSNRFTLILPNSSAFILSATIL